MVLGNWGVDVALERLDPLTAWIRGLCGCVVCVRVYVRLRYCARTLHTCLDWVQQVFFSMDPLLEPRMDSYGPPMDLLLDPLMDHPYGPPL